MKQNANRFIPTTLAGVIAALVFITGSAVPALASQIIRRHLPEIVSRLQKVRPLNDTNRLHLAIALPLRNRDGLTNLLKQIYDPASPNYHHYLTPDEFTRRFGPTEADYKKLRTFATSHHLAISGSHRNRMLLDVEGTVGDIGKTMHTGFHVYHHPTEKRDFYAPDSDPSIDLDLPVLCVSGLNNYYVPHPLSVRKPMPAAGAGASATGTGSGPSGSFMGYDFRSAYLPGVNLTGTGQNVALLEFDSGFFQSDITSYEAANGLPNVPVQTVLLNGYDGGAGSLDGNGEVSLDIEMAVSMAPGLNRIIVYEGDVPDDVFNRMATDNQASQIGASWFYQTDAASDQIYQELAAQGVSFFNASGDSDAYVGAIYPPADDPNIIIVGGTTLTTTGPRGAWVTEQAWNWGLTPPGGNPAVNGYSGTGGGFSTTVPIPYWQAGVNMSQNMGSTAFRNLPDVALTSDNIWVDYGDGLGGIFGGTSAATPLWAGLCALINEQGSANGETNQGFFNPAVYAIGLSNQYQNCFHDTVIGNNEWSGSPNLFSAVPGYDLCTGWGTPNGKTLINNLAPIATNAVLRVLTNSISGGNGNGVIDYDECNNLTFTLTNQSPVEGTNVTATLYSSTPGAIVAQATASYPPIFGHSSSVNLTPFTLSTEPDFICGTPVNLTLVVKSDQSIETNVITLPSGVIGSPDTFTSTTAIPIPNTNFVPINSPIVISGLQSVGNLTVSVNMQALYDAGVSLELISPSGTNVILSENNGGLGANYGVACAPGLETTFDDNALTPIANGAPPFIGSFQPEQPLSVFKLASGTNLNGVWNLQVLDEFPGDTAQLGCWSLNISPNVCADGGGQCPGADLSLTMAASPSTVFIGSNLIYTMTVSNAGPGTADNVVVAQSLPPGVGFVTTSNYPVNVSQTGSNLNIVFGSLPVYSAATVSVITIPTIPGLQTSSATVGSQETDPNPANNTASASVIVSQPTADVGVTMTASSSSVLQGALLTYTINVTNNGPFPANNVILTNTLPQNVNFISATTSQGSIINNGTFASLGTLPFGSNAVISITISPTITGSITASTLVSISSTETDPIAFNNSASATTVVGPAADVGITGYTTNNPVIAGQMFTNIFTVQNYGPNVATGVGFSQSIPTEATFISSTIAGNTVSNGFITGAVAASMNSGQTIMITNVFTAAPLLPGDSSELIFSTIKVTTQSGDPNTNNNQLTLQTVGELPVITIVPSGATITSGSATGAMGPTGNYGVQLYLQNTGTLPTTNLAATLVNSNGVLFSSGSQTYGALPPGGGAIGKPFTFTANSTNGGTITATLKLQDGSSNYPPVNFTFSMPVVKSFWNTNLISVPQPQNVPQPGDGPASPYPSPIVVSGVGSNVSTVTVTLSNLFHTYPNDIGVLLVGPSGASCVLMSAVADFSTMSAPATITFDPNATVLMPDFGTIVSGTYLPEDYYQSQYDTNETFSNSPVPVGPYNTNLAVFAGAPANGTWSLYVEDDGAGDYGAISNGWGLTITTVTPVNQVADLGISVAASTNQTGLNSSVTYYWTVTNSGPNSVTNATVMNILPSGLVFVANYLPPGVTSSQNGLTNIFTIPGMAPHTGLLLTNVVVASLAGAQANTASINSIALDPNPVNNTATAVTTVLPPPVYLSLAPLSIAPNPAVINNNAVVTLWVANTGPSNAYNVVGTFTSSASFLLAGSNVSQGSFASGNYTSPRTAVQINLGTLGVGPGAAAEIILTNTQLAFGAATNSFTVTTTSTNLNYASNTVSMVTTVGYPLAVISNGPPTLLSQASPPYNGAINSGQTNTVSFSFINTGAGPTTNLWATLVANSGIRPITVSNSYGVIPAGGSVSVPFTFVGTGSPGAAITAQFSLRDGNNTNFAPVTFHFMIPMTASFANSGAITIPLIGPASPYPAVIQVSGLTNGNTNLLLSKVTATLKGFAHTFPSDVEAVLVSPTGQEVPLMEHAGGYHSVNNLTLNFDDAATAALPLSNALASGTFLPTEYAPFDSLPGLAPIATNSPALGTFNGANPNGIWSLYVYDDSQGDDGVIANGWTLDLTAVSTVNPAARLALSTYATPNPAFVGDYITYQITVTDMGPGDATSVVLTNILPLNMTLASAPTIEPSGSYTTSGRDVVCNLGAISNGDSAYITIQSAVAAGNTLTNVAIVSTASADLDLADSTNVVTTPIIQVAGALSASATDNGQLHLSVAGNPGQIYVVQTSTNLVNWTSIATNTGVFSLTDTISNCPQRFYRLVQQAH